METTSSTMGCTYMKKYLKDRSPVSEKKFTGGLGAILISNSAYAVTPVNAVNARHSTETDGLSPRYGDGARLTDPSIRLRRTRCKLGICNASELLSCTLRNTAIYSMPPTNFQPIFSLQTQRDGVESSQPSLKRKITDTEEGDIDKEKEEETQTVQGAERIEICAADHEREPFPGSHGGECALTEEGRAQLEGIIAHHQRIVVEIEAEAAIALEALKTLTKQQNEAHAWLASLSTTVDKGSLPQVIKHEEALLGDIDERMMNVEGELHCLGGLEHEDVTYPGNNPLPEPSDDVKHGIEQNRRELRRLLDDYQNVSKKLALRGQLSPIRKVPPEIIRLIFLFWDADRPRRRTATYVSPNVLTSVCIAWKNIAMGTPDSHAGIDYTLPTILTTESESEDPIDSVVSSMFEVFIPHHARWQKVRIRYELYLEKSYWLEQDDVDRITSTMISAPWLHSVSWLSQKPFTTLTFPWAQLTHFWLGHIISMTEGLRIITSCPQLTSLELTLILPVQVAITNGSGSIVHKNLQRLHLSTAGDLGILFDKLTLPALNDLSLSEVHGSSTKMESQYRHPSPTGANLYTSLFFVIETSRTVATLQPSPITGSDL
ncbi:uncharacterized protein LACBIDRAFT_329446 [Laccaria bicolor S238N-H82]|uniref:Predicted protein n=1 Tax=Laccaria bicolor (strain S238N-H82 / ATCC MYA-4686) TaxID=486041 RepID=B0DI21_LACBS|nr:uncharacterized protein LACBIDRAFT_329446 [Laccaria bicolor S238N-H82]EDR05831.1 predicted protein [Laccaria bicolor S238N-H82]|eukprot:XP_001883507.1 predicted protein [Laccaria bicolor S238N-H82]